MSGTLRAIRRPAFGRLVLVVVAMLAATAAGAQSNNVTADKTDSSNKSPAGYTPDPITTTSLPLSGKLFFTDDKRTQLDRARRDGTIVVEGDVIQRTTVLNGFVKRSDGGTTYWVNGGGKTESRYVRVPLREVTVAPNMVGAEPAFVLPGANAAQTIDATKGQPQSTDVPGASKKKVAVKKPAQPPAKKPAP